MLSTFPVPPIDRCHVQYGASVSDPSLVTVSTVDLDILMDTLPLRLRCAVQDTLRMLRPVYGSSVTLVLPNVDAETLVDAHRRYAA